jgi:hypothetical protein
MPNPTRAEFHTDKTLTDMSVGWMQDEANFVADRFAPAVYTQDRSGNYVVFNRGDWNRDEMKPRAPSTESEGSGYSLSRDPLNITRKAFHKDTDYVESADADEVLDPEQEAADFVTQKALIHREGMFADGLLAGTAPGTPWSFLAEGVNSGATPDATFDPTSATLNKILRWNDPTSKPLKDMSKGRTRLARSGKRANTLLLTFGVFEALAIHPDILDLIKGGATPGQSAVATENDLARIFHVERVLVMSGIENAAAKGQAESNAFFGGNSALLAYVTPRPGRYTASASYTFTLRNANVDGLSSRGTRLQRLEMPLKTSFRVEIENYTQPKVVAADLGYFFYSIIV